jgi:CRISPR/Cas system-associated exonuclease Cas4 (RecB family)
MSKIIDVRTAVINFLKENIQPYEITVIKLDKIIDTWEAIAEVYEDDSFLKSMNLPPKHSRVYYSVKVDDQLEVVAFERMSEYNQ